MRPHSAAVSFALLREGLGRRLPGQATIAVPILVIAWIARDLPATDIVWALLGLQVVTQLLIAASSQWLRRGLTPAHTPRLRHALWMACEASSGLAWGVLLAEVAAIDGSVIALHIWVTVLITMAVSVILAAPVAGIAFPLLCGFAIGLFGATALNAASIDASAMIALVALIGALVIIALAVNAQARAGSRAQLEVASLSRRLEEELGQVTWLSQHDVLTGLRNRRAARDAVKRMEDGPLALVVLDIDHFKAINDRFGHDTGDAVLETVAHHLWTEVREIVPEALIARWGGEEFMIVLPQASIEEARHLSETVRQSFANLAGDALPQGLAVTASFGVASGGAGNFDRVVRAADKALYSAKALGRDRVMVHTEEADGAETKSGSERAA